MRELTAFIVDCQNSHYETNSIRTNFIENFVGEAPIKTCFSLHEKLPNFRRTRNHRFVLYLSSRWHVELIRASSSSSTFGSYNATRPKSRGQTPTLRCSFRCFSRWSSTSCASYLLIFDKSRNEREGCCRIKIECFVPSQTNDKAKWIENILYFIFKLSTSQMLMTVFFSFFKSFHFLMLCNLKHSAIIVLAFYFMKLRRSKWSAWHSGKFQCRPFRPTLQPKC